MQERSGDSSWWAPDSATLWVGPHSDPDRYRVLETASAGAEGKILKGELDLDGHPIPVAVKVLHDDQEDLSDWERRWTRQTEILRTVSHPCLVGVREVFAGAGPHRRGDRPEGDDRLYLVMNWASGERLDEWAKGRRSADVVPVLGALAEAIDYLHSGRGSNGLGVLHRDIKPANVIVSAGRPVLVDFGFARFEQQREETVVVYSRNFAAPEVMRGEAPNSSADRFAFAATALRVLTGLTPSGSTPQQARAALAQTEVPAPLVEHLIATLDPDPARRPGDLGVWYVTEQGLHASGAVPVVPAPPPAPVSAVAPTAGTVMRTSQDPVTQPLAAPVGESATSNLGSVMAVLSLLLVVVAALAIGAWLLLFSGGETVVIPDVVGSTLQEAEAAFDDVSVTLTPEFVQSKEEAGTVLAVSPRPGTEVDAGSEVRLDVASRNFTMPDVTGQEVTDALDEILSRGVAAEKIELIPKPVQDRDLWCTVESQRPGPAPRLDRDSQVGLDVAVAPSDDVDVCLRGEG